MAIENSRFSAQVQLMDDRLALIHIPLDIYPFFLGPIMQLLFHDISPIDDYDGGDTDTLENNVPKESLPSFTNISITPVECSVICSRKLANLYFASMAESFNQNAVRTDGKIQISEEDFLVMQVEGQGLNDAGQRVLELTCPLAMAGISIFFISTYFSDYILVPRNSKEHVAQALADRGFIVEETTYPSNGVPSTQRRDSTPAVARERSPTPPPHSVSELLSRTSKSFRQHHIHPRADRSLRLVHCAAHYREPSGTKSYVILRPHLITALLRDNPRFLSLTIAAADPAPSIIFEKRLLPRFSLDRPPDAGAINQVVEDTNLLLGSKEEVLVAITLDLRDLPFDATGIICGVAGRLAVGLYNKENNSDDNATADGPNLTPPSQNHGQHCGLPGDVTSDGKSFEITFLSTARSGTVIVSENELDQAMACLGAGS